MWTWVRGIRIITANAQKASVPLEAFIASVASPLVTRAAGTAMFLTSTPEMTPTALIQNLKHNKVFHEANVIVTVRTASTPFVDANERVHLRKLSPEFSTIETRYGLFSKVQIFPARLCSQMLRASSSTLCRPHSAARRGRTEVAGRIP